MNADAQEVKTAVGFMAGLLCPSLMTEVVNLAPFYSVLNRGQDQAYHNHYSSQLKN